MPTSESFPETPLVSTPASFACSLQHSGRDAVWVRLSGELDLAVAQRLATCLEEALSGARLVVIDLRELTFMDSTGLSVIVDGHDRARRSARRLILIRGPRQVDQLFKRTEVADRLEITNLQSSA